MRNLIMSSLFCCFQIGPSFGAIPVIDGANLAESIRQLIQMQQAYERQFEQLQEAVKQVDAITGNYGFGELFNSQVYRDARRYAPSSWQDTLRILEAGGLPGSASDTREIYEALVRALQIGAAEEIDRRDGTSPNAMAHERRRDTAYASMAVAERAFDETEERTVNYEVMMSQIEEADDAKAVADLNVRVGVENGLSLNELVRLQTLRVQQQASSDQQLLVDATNIAAMLRYETHPLGNIPTQ
ncbi:MAG: type IV secretion system protein [Pseudomonadota bacterium]